MNKKINKSKILRILGIFILFLNIGSILGSAADSNVYIYAMSNAHIYIDGVYKGDAKNGYLATTLPAYTTHTLKVTADGTYDYVSTFVVKAGYMFIGTQSIPIAWGWGSNPTPAPTTTPKATPIPTYTPKPTITPVTTITPIPTYTPRPISTPAPSLSDKYIEINSEPSGAKVYYGSTYIGTTPFNYKVMETQLITFKLPGYKDKITYIEQITRSPFKVYLSRLLI